VLNAAIRCDALGKRYRMYGKPRDRLLESFSQLASRWLAVPLVAYGHDFWALRHVSFTVGRGETVAIIGRNGAGKSTLLQIIAGTLTPTEGTAAVNGRVAALLELGAGFNREFTGIENVWMSAGILGLSRKEIARRLDDILAFADIGEYIHQPVKTYSSGMYVRLAFSVCMHVEPDILIVDEALAVGDMAFQAKCMARIRRFQQEGKTLLFVSHDVDAVRALCDRCIYLDRGGVLEMGDTALVVDRFIRDIHAEQAVDLQPGEFEAPIPVPNRASAAVPLSFEQRFAAFDAARQGESHGTGEARIRLVELLDDADRPLELAEFDAEAKIRIWIECIRPCTVSVNYKIRDRHLVSVAGADFLIAGHNLLEMAEGRCYRVDYATHLPLKDGEYSLRISLTVPIAKHAQAVFVDVVEVTHPFKLLSSSRGKIYTQVYLPNSVSVYTYDEVFADAIQ
jgi:lipopolysaccharide transport system ATP-binding protein